jgi:hypothetical protein
LSSSGGGLPPDWAFFFSGGAHVYYGLLVLAIAALLAVLSLLSGFWLGVVSLVVAVGVFVDLWAHNYRH